MTGRFRRLWSPAARVERRGNFRAPSATFLWVWVEEEAAGRRSSTVSSGGSEYGIGGEGAPVVDKRKGVVGALREGEALLMAGSAWAEEVWIGAVRVDDGGVLGVRGGELERM